MSGDQLDLNAIEADLNNPWLPVGTVEPHVPALVAEVRRLREERDSYRRSYLELHEATTDTRW